MWWRRCGGGCAVVVDAVHASNRGGGGVAVTLAVHASNGGEEGDGGAAALAVLLSCHWGTIPLYLGVR